MNDFDYDCAQKKRIARGAFNRKGTTGRKGCRLPYENLTKKEREALNGNITTIRLNDKLKWDDFKKLSPELQAEYLQHKLDAFGVGLSTIGTGLFGVTKSTLTEHCKAKGINVTVRNHGKAPVAAMVSWQRWLDGEPKSAPVIETTDVPQVTMCEEDFLPNTGTANKIKAPQGAAETKPFRAHDFEDMFRECGMEREEKAEEPNAEPEEIGCPYPLTNMSMTLKGTPIDILTTLRLSFPTLLDEDKTYRFTIKADDYVL